ncbi:MAG: metallophosphoesterase [Firmicutes bacterium HGW-Firmicutes-2]|jgi:putative phosphoesterase|nr:MAG: metallophosphoesterase [Firmicutes bacterium HGW-Firmicutes-2]
MEKYAFISDIHGNDMALKAVLEDIRSRNIPMSHVLCLGDLVGYGPRPNEVIERIKTHKIRTILGNYDEAVGFYLPTCGCKLHSKREKDWMENSLSVSLKLTTEDNKAFLRELEDRILIDINGHRVLLVHGSPFSIVEYVFEESLEIQKSIIEEVDADIIMFGHTHFPYIKIVGEKTLINTGSVGRPKDGDNRAGYVMIDFTHEVQAEIIRVEYDVCEVRRQIVDSEFLDVFGDIVVMGSTNVKKKDYNTLNEKCKVL